MSRDEWEERRLLADVNGDPRPRGLADIVALAMFVIGVLLFLAWFTGHVEVTIR